MKTAKTRYLALAASLAAAFTASALLAYPGGWNDPFAPRAAGRLPSSGQRPPNLEGRIEVARFHFDGAAAQALAKGLLTVAPRSIEGTPDDPRRSAIFEAAIEDRLLQFGYSRAPSGTSEGQLAQVSIASREIIPAEQKHKPLSGEMTMGVSNHGTMLGLGLHYDGTKPRKALVATKLETRIVDKANGVLIWEGRAEIITRDGDQRWDDQAIARKLAAVLFDGFPSRTGEQSLRR